MENMHVLFAFIFCILLTIVKWSEPMCSKFDYQEQLLEKMIRTEIKVESMEASIKTTQTEMINVLKSLQIDIKTELNKTQQEIKHQLETLSGEMKKYDGEIASFKEESDEKINTAISTMDTSFKQIEGQIGRMSADLVQLENNTIKRLTDQAVIPTSAFNARSLVDKSPATGQNLVFRTNILNEGAGYDKTTGIFTAPVTGLYVFSVQFCNVIRKYINFAFMIDDQQTTVSTIGDEDYRVCSSVDTTAVMTKGMKAWVKCTTGSSSDKLFESSEHWNMFSGFLVHK